MCCYTLVYFILLAFTHANDIHLHNNSENDRRSQPVAEIPESLLIEMKDVKNWTYFWDNYVAAELDDSIPYNSLEGFAYENTLHARSNSNRDRSESSSSDINLAPAALAGCAPLKAAVEVPREEDPMLFYWPMCVYVNRCSGCCPSQLLDCQPTRASLVNFKVMKARYAGPQSSKFIPEGFSIVTLEKHEKCSCECKTKPEHCTRNQVYNEGQCRCICPNQQEMNECDSHLKFWDIEDCACKCKDMHTCSSGHVFNTRTCRCQDIRVPLTERRRQPVDNETSSNEIVFPND